MNKCRVEKIEAKCNEISDVVSGRVLYISCLLFSTIVASTLDGAGTLVVSPIIHNLPRRD